MEAGITTMPGAVKAPVERSGVRTSSAKFGGAMAPIGALVMFAGAATWASTGLDLDAALTDGTVGDYLVDAADNMSALTTNLSLWMFGVVFMVAGGIGLSRIAPSDSAVANAARGSFMVGGALALAAFSIWMGIVRELAPAHAAGTDLAAVGAALGQAATIADWVATALIIGVGPALISISGKGSWVPRWLFVWSAVALLASVISIIGLYTDQRATISFINVPIGLAWMIAAGIVALRHRA